MVVIKSFPRHTGIVCLRYCTQGCKPAHMPITEPPLTVTEASEKTGIKYRAIQQAILRGRLPAHKPKGRTAAYLIDPADLDDWATRRRERAS